VALAELFRQAGRDIDAAVRQDPAARSRAEVALCYPGLHALWMHRVSHGLWKQGFVLLPRFLSNMARFYTGVEIHPGAKIGDEVFIDHGMGVVIGETAEVGDGCVLYKGVVLGGVSQARVRRHPHLGRQVVVGSNACVLGAIDVGDGARIGSGSVVIRDVPARSTVVGIPGRVVAGQHQSDDELHADLPDPVAEAMQRLSGRLAKLEETLGVHPEPADPLDNPFDGLVEGRKHFEPEAPIPIAQGAARRSRRKKP
jgi:serine O-acetyltransferase